MEARRELAIGDRGIQSVYRHRNPWPCGVVSGGETPNLMLGTAGIGYFYLRLYDSGAVPSVLLVRSCPRPHPQAGIASLAGLLGPGPGRLLLM